MRGARHRSTHGFLIAPAAKLFEDLGIGATLCRDDLWRPIHGHLEIMSFEIEHGAISERYAYNDRCVTEAARTRKSVLAEHRGFWGLFVPICCRGRTDGQLIVGPFGVAWPSGAEIHERWRSLTGRQGHLADPELSRYLETTLGMTVLEGGRTADLRRWLELLASLIAGEGDPAAIETEMDLLRRHLMTARFVDRIWDAARLMVDERTTRVWSSSARKDQRPDLGLRRFPDHVAVGLIAGRTSDVDPVDDRVRRHAFQRACVELAAEKGDALSGRIGDYGVTFLTASRGSSARSERWLGELGERASSLARRRFGLGVRFGVSVLSLPLPRQYQAALAAAETALSGDVSVVHAKRAAPTKSPLPKLRQELLRLLEVDAQGLSARFDRFLEAVAVHTAYRPEPARAHLEVTFDQMTETLSRAGALESKGLEAQKAVLERGAGEAQTLEELFTAYRLAVSDLALAVERPSAARKERSLRRAQEHLRQHYAEPVILARVAQIAGFAPSYFSALFHREHGTTFEQYLLDLRLTRAKELLMDTSLSLQRIAQLSGFSRATYLSRMFKRETSETPIAYRRRTLHEPRAKRGR